MKLTQNIGLSPADPRYFADGAGRTRIPVGFASRPPAGHWL